jgi:1-deoxy-D-xylulose-5-phosphate synthase
MTEPQNDPPAGSAAEEQPEPLLVDIESPEDVKRLELEQLPQLTNELREFLLDSVQTTGGHLGSNLGVVEIAVALHRVFDFRRDRLIWDVSHQCYPHKVLTGRKGRFQSLRRTDGLCGFTHPAESEYDLFHTGHAGTSISIGLGLATAFAGEADPPQVVSVIGDASLGAGVAFEGLNNAGATGTKLLVVLNDNEWSISRSVGSLAKYLSRIRSNRLVQRAGQETKNLIQAIPLIGPKFDKALDDLGEVMRHAVVPGHVFEELGVTYVGPIDGHDVLGLVQAFERVRQLEGTVVLHCLTDKGKGHPKAPDHPERVHAVKAASPVSAVQYKTDGSKSTVDEAAPISFTQAFADALTRAAEGDVRVHALTAGMPSGTGLDRFAERFPARFHDTGITEQHAIAMAAGMAKAGLRPVAAIYSTFLQRGYDQVFQEAALQGLPIVFGLDRAGPVGQDGPTHNGVFDLAFLRTLPGMTLGAPRDATDMERMLKLMLTLDGPSALRYPRGNCPREEVLPAAERRAMRPGKAEVLCEGEQITLWAYGPMVSTAIKVAQRFEARGIHLGVVDARWAKPLDEELLARQLREQRWIVTLEDHQRAGGFGSALLEAASRLPQGDGPSARIRVLGIPDRYIEHRTTREEQLAEAGLDADSVERILQALVSPSRVG